MKVLYISYDGMTDALGRSQVIPYLLGLADRDHEIEIISCEKKNISETEKAEVAQVLAQYQIKWHPLSFSSRPPGLSKLFDVVKIKKKAHQLHSLNSYDIVHCRSYIAALAGLELKLKYGVRFVFDMRGFWANERIEGDIWNLKNPLYKIIYRYFKRKEKEFFNHSDAVISLTHNGKSIIGQLFGTEIERKTTVIPCCVDTELFSYTSIDEEKRDELRLQLGIRKDDFVLSYLGSIGTWYMTAEMMMFFKVLKKRYTRARFLFISGDAPQSIKQQAVAYGVDPENIIVARASRNEVPLYLSLSDLSIFFIRPVFSKKASSPTKQAEIMSMGIPAVCNAGVGDTDNIIAGENAGVVIQNLNVADFEKVVDKLDDLLKSDPVKIRSSAIKLFSLKDGVKSYAKVYAEISP